MLTMNILHRLMGLLDRRLVGLLYWRLMGWLDWRDRNTMICYDEDSEDNTKNTNCHVAKTYHLFSYFFLLLRIFTYLGGVLAVGSLGMTLESKTFHTR